MPGISDTQLQEILDEMFRRVNTKRSELDVTKPGWYQQRSWTHAEEDSFIDWLTAYLQKNLKLSKRWAHKEAKKFSSFFGWTTKPSP